MSDWENKTDFEINKLVGESLGLDLSGINEEINRMYDSVKDYCNDPSRAWPIMMENNISIRLRNGMFKNESHCYPIARSGNIWHSDKNALRATMIVFLKLKGVKP